MLLPKSYKIAELLVHWCHEQVAHTGQGVTMNQLRSSRCNSLVRYIILKCLRCKQLCGRLQQQKVADSLLGSFLVKNGQKEVKRYSAVNTCLSSRAIHIKVVYSLSTDSFIMSLRRFVACKCNVRMIRSDN